MGWGRWHGSGRPAQPCRGAGQMQMGACRRARMLGGSMMDGLFVRGLLVGLAIAAPVGPIGVLCIQRTLSHGVVRGLVTGLGSATVHALYGAMVGFGLVAVIDAFSAGQLWLRLAGGGYLLYLAQRILRAKPELQSQHSRGTGLAASYGSAFLLDLSSPGTLVLFIAIFAGIGTTQAAGNYRDTAVLVVGVLAGSTLWWILLSGGVSLLRHRLNTGWLLWVNRLSALILTGFALFVLWGLIENFPG